MKKIFILFFSLIIVFNFSVKADEGMWLPLLLQKLNIEKMQEMGCKLTAEQIFSLNSSSLKDAIVALDHGSCTGELVSPDGLLLTNHHCGFGEIQEHSSEEHNYLADGFWAMSKEEELSNPGKTVSFLISVENITDQILPKLDNSLAEYARFDMVDSIAEIIINKAIEGNHYEAEVLDMFDNNQYYLFVYETFRDIRLVGAPPSVIGKFGGDIDNWMWPRHTGDFSMFRVYCGPDGKPADYSTENVPYHPKHYLPVSLEGYKKGDFAMILGYPGSTDRYLTSYGIKELLEISNPNRIKIRGKKQEIWAEDMAANSKIRIQYASKYAGSSNYWKYSIGQNKGLKKLNVYGKKQELENRFTEWMNTDQARKDKYKNALSLIDEAYKERGPYRHAFQFLLETMMYGTEIVSMATEAMPLYRVLKHTPDSTAQINNIIEDIKANSTAFFKDYNPSTDQKVLAAMLELYDNNVDKKYHPAIYDVIHGKYKGDYNKYAAFVFAKSAFTNATKLEALLAKPSTKALEKDPAFSLMLTIINKYSGIRDKYFAVSENINKGDRLFAQGLLEMDNKKALYPNANSTMRVTYGAVGDYDPRDAVHYDYQTTMKGIVEKTNPDDKPNYFNTPQKLLDIYNSKDFGIYGENGVMPVAFTTNNDITGGNSGSPVINAKGHLIGIAFDGNWEAMSGDIAFETELQKCINVDIRYVLLVIDKIGGAKHLIDEMTIIEKTTEPAVEEVPEEIPVEIEE